MVKQLAKSVLLSLEALWVLLSIPAWWLFTPQFARVDRLVTSVEWYYLITPCAALLVFCVGCLKQILFPPKNATALCHWPLYPQFRITAFVGVFLPALALVAVVVGSMARGSLPDGVSLLLLIAGYGVAGISAITMLHAAMKVRSVVVGGN